MSGVKYPEIQRQLEDILLRDSRYRDHFLHQFQVFLLGAYIIDKMYACKSKCLKDFKKKSGVPIENAWLFASTYHDFNYSIQRYDTWSQEFFSQALSTSCQLSSLKLDSAFIRENFLLKTGEICELLGIEMDNVVMNFFFEQATMERNHGLLSALSLLKLFENSGKSRMPRHALVQAALAIAIHDNGIWLHLSGKKDVNDKHTKPWNDNFAAMKVMENLTLQDYPLAFLLVFCDTVQEWGRVGGYYTTSLPLLEDIDVITNPFNIEVSISVKDNDSYQHKEDEIEQVAEFLKDNRFVIKLRSRTGNKEVKVPMEGTV